MSKLIVWCVQPKCHHYSTSYRNIKAISNILNVPFVEDKLSLGVARAMTDCEYPDIIFGGWVVLPWIKWRDEYMDLMQKSERTIWLREEYGPEWKIDNRLFDVLADEVWTSVKYMVEEQVETNYYYYDWGKFALAPYYRRRWTPEKRGIIYFGQLRQERMEYFERYMHPNKYDVSIAAKKKERENWLAFDSRIHTFQETEPTRFNVFEGSIYIENPWMHEHDCSISRRFYEIVHTGLPCFIDRNSLPTFDRYRIPILKGWIVNDAGDLYHGLLNASRIQHGQQQLWDTDVWYAEAEADFLQLCRERSVI